MKSVIINLDKDKDRLKESLEHLATFGIYPERIAGVVRDNPNTGFSIAMLRALEAIKDEEVALVLEDDVFLKSFDIPELPEGWDMLYLGANLTKQTTRINDKIVKVNGAWTTHAIMYSKKGVNKILREYSVDKGVFDEWLRSDFNIKNECYMVTPMIAYQRKGYSNIQGIEKNYISVMNENYNIFVI